MLKDIENLGWRLDSRELVEGADAGEGTPKRYRYIFASLVIDAKGSPTEIWDGPAGGYGQFPNTHPVGWSEKDLVYSDGERIPDEIMANELARNQTPNNWLSSYVNIIQEFQKVMYRKKLMEEAKQQAERGIEEGAADTFMQLQTHGSPGYTASSPVYGNSPVVGMVAANPYQSMGFGAAAASLQPYSPVGFQSAPGSPAYSAYSAYNPTSPQYSASSPVVLSGQPMNVVVPTNPLQAVMPVMSIGAQAQGAQGVQGAQGILSVEKQQPKEDEEKGVSQGKKTVFISS